MIAAPLPPADSSESLYSEVTRWAGHASRRRLEGILLAGAAVIVVVAVTGIERWPFASAAGSLMMIALWGLVAHAPDANHRPALRLARAVATGLGMALGILAAVGLLFWILGPSWKL